jgi:hypothetical protein
MKSSATPTVRTFRNEPRRRFSTQYKRELVEMVMASPRQRQAIWLVSDNYLGRRIDSGFLLPS